MKAGGVCVCCPIEGGLVGKTYLPSLRGGKGRKKREKEEDVLKTMQ